MSLKQCAFNNLIISGMKEMLTLPTRFYIDESHTFTFYGKGSALFRFTVPAGGNMTIYFFAYVKEYASSNFAISGQPCPDQTVGWISNSTFVAEGQQKIDKRVLRSFEEHNNLLTGMVIE